MFKKLLVIFITLLLLVACAIQTQPETLPANDYNDTVYEIPAPDYEPATESPLETQGEDVVEVAHFSFTLTPTNLEFGSIPGDELSDEQIAEMSKHMIQFGNYLLVSYLFCVNNIPFDREDYIFRSPYSRVPYFRVTTFSTIQEIMNATESVFSARISEHYHEVLLDKLYWHQPLFIEVDGVLYARDANGGCSVPFSPQINSVISAEPDRIVVMAYMLNHPPVPPTQAELVIVREHGRWLIDDNLLHRPQQ